MILQAADLQNIRDVVLTAFPHCVEVADDAPLMAIVGWIEEQDWGGDGVYRSNPCDVSDSKYIINSDEFCWAFDGGAFYFVDAARAVLFKLRWV